MPLAWQDGREDREDGEKTIFDPLTRLNGCAIVIEPKIRFLED